MSRDGTFKTLALSGDIANFKFEDIRESEVSLAWNTMVPTRTTLEITNTRDGSKRTVEDPSYLTEHKQSITDLKPASNYNVTINSYNEKGSKTSSNTIPFSTILTKNPPILSEVKTTSSLIPGKVEQVQSIVTWKTDKPSTSRVLFDDNIGMEGKLSYATDKDNALTQDHIMITTAFKPGKVYRYRVESTDALGNTTYSNDFTILTPKPKETVVDLIVKNFEDTFGFLRR